MESNIESKFIKSGIWLYVFSYLIAPITFFTKVFLTQQLTPSQVGVLYTIIGALLILNSLGDFGIGQTYLKLIPEKLSQKKYDKVLGIFCFGLAIQILIGLIVWGIIFFVSDGISIYFFDSLELSSTLKVFSGFFIVYNIYQGFSMLYLSLGDTFVQKGVDFIRMLLLLCILYIVSLLYPPVLLYYSQAWLLSVIVGLIIFIVIFYFKVYRHIFKGIKPKINKVDIREILSQSLPFLFAAQSTYILSQIDILMVQYFLGSQQAGYYSVYVSIISIPFMVCGPIFALFLPLFSSYYGQGREKDIYRLKNFLQKLFLVIGLIWTVIFLYFGQSITTILFSTNYKVSYDILLMSIIFLPFIFLHQINFSVYNATGKIKTRLIIIMSTIVINILTNILAIKYLGVTGVALATGFGWFYIWFMTEVLDNKGFNLDFEFLLRNLGLSILLYIIYMTSGINFHELLSDYNIFTKICIVVIGSICLSCLFLLLNKDLFKNSITYLKKRK